uniref:1-phosphatidylinositol-3-phosphate 5-kinase n=1 Tax=Cannabis sativa TaxID=3483 RepID=A0A803NTI6_CANSA
MGTPDKKLSELVDIVRSWIPRKSEPANVSRDFWMPDQSCRVCYECDSQFTVFNRRHHCRLCGRVFCAKCTANSIPALSNEPRSPRTGREDGERIRVCSYCYKQWEQGISVGDNGTGAPSPGLSPSPSAVSLASTKSSCTGQSSGSTAGSTPYSTGPYQHVPCGSSLSPRQSSQMDSVTEQEKNEASQRSTNLNTVMEDSLPKQYSFCSNRSDEEDEYGAYHSDSETRHFSSVDGYYTAVGIDDIDQVYGSHDLHSDEENVDVTTLAYSPFPEHYNAEGVAETRVGEEADQHKKSEEHESPSYDEEKKNAEPVDFENNGLLWLPPEPEDEEDDREAVLFDDDDEEEEGGVTGEWGYLRSSNSFGGGEYRSREKSGEEHRNAMKNVVEGHFKALVAQLLQVENLPVGDDDDKEGWLEIITSLSWEAATLLKPDMSKGGGMDPGGYVKVKCIACGCRSESMVVKGVVCKKNVAHRRMTTRIEKPRFLILGGALEYQRVSNLLSSFDTLLQQEMDHLKMAVAKIDAHHPDVLLVEKSVSRYAQDYLLAKNISLVLNIKRPLLERIARCTGAQIVSSIDHLTSPKLGYCDVFHVDKLLEAHGSAGQGGRKLTKTLMFFEGCPKPLGTILLKGASGDELKKVKHVVQYGVLQLITWHLRHLFWLMKVLHFGVPLRSPITVALPDKPSGVLVDGNLSTNHDPVLKLEADNSSCFVAPPDSPYSVVSPTSLPPLGHDSSTWSHDKLFQLRSLRMLIVWVLNFRPKQPSLEIFRDSSLVSNYVGDSESFEEVNGTKHADENTSIANHQGTLEEASIHQFGIDINEVGSSKEDFPPSPSDHQSILVSLSTRCVWNGSVCERAHLFRIKYYGNFDKPLGRFLRDHLFDQTRSLTISVKKFPEFLLPGEKEGKIWMWHRCLRCPRINGFPPATRRVLMSDAAWGLSFGKFLELSFSNHAAASRVASCGHSLHRDCLRFYGFGTMVACFRYASIDVLSVFLPPPKLEFYYADQEWIQKEANEVRKQVDLLFNEVQNAFHQVLQKISAMGVQDASMRESKQQIPELGEMLRKDKEQFQELLDKALYNEVKAGKPAIDILEINKLRRQILLNSHAWDQRLTNAANLSKNSLQLGSIPKLKENSFSSLAKEFCTNLEQGAGAQNSNEIVLAQSYRSEEEACLSSCADTNDHSELETGKQVRRTHSAGENPVVADLSDTLDAAWTGEYPTSVAPKDDTSSSPSDSTLVKTVSENPKLENSTFDQGKVEAIRSVSSAVSLKGLENVEHSTSKNLSSGSQKHSSGEYHPVHISLVQELEQQSGARFLLTVGVGGIVLPVYDDEPTSIVAHTLISSDESYRSFGSSDESILSTSGSRSSQVVDPVLYSKDLHIRISFTDHGSLGTVKYTVTCYYAKRFEALRRICCPSEIDFVRSLSRCKKWGAQGGKSNVFFAKTLDDRFIIKQVTKTELDSFLKFGPAYFKYLSESINTGSPTCLAKILGIYQVSSKHVKGGKESKMDVLSIDVMDYSLLVGVDEEKHELVLGIIDFMRQYTWDKHLETWVKTSGFLGGPRNTSPTVISPQQYKKRFRKAMTTYFLMVPDQWSPPTIIPSESQSDLRDENAQGP